MNAKCSILPMNQTQVVCLVMLVALMLLAAPAQTTHAATITVPCDVTALVNAINTANANGGANVIELAAGCTYTLTAINNTGADGDNGLPQITSDLSINAHAATIQRNAAEEFRFFQVNSGAALRLNEITLRDGRVVGNQKIDGGAMFNNGGTMVVTNSTFTNNSAGCGGAVYNQAGSFSATNVTFADGSADA